MTSTPTNGRAETYHVSPVGHVRRDDGRTILQILPAFVPALKELEQYSHVQVVWWFSEFDDAAHRETTRFEEMPFEAPPLGIFACRAPMRPNPIGLTTTRILAVDHDRGHVEVAAMDAFDGTPVLDLKGYLPHYDRVRDVGVPPWAAEWPRWVVEDETGLEGRCER